MNFEEWAVSGGLDVKKFPMSNIYKDADTRVASVAWQEQQAKIGILQIKLNGADERAAAVLNHKNKMIDELQAKVDEALNTLCNLQYSSGERIYNDVGNILKGNKQHIHKFEEITVNGDDARKYICIYCGFEKSESFND